MALFLPFPTKARFAFGGHSQPYAAFTADGMNSKAERTKHVKAFKLKAGCGSAGVSLTRGAAVSAVLNAAPLRHYCLKPSQSMSR